MAGETGAVALVAAAAGQALIAEKALCLCARFRPATFDDDNEVTT
jgi:hypothetical protein